MLKNPDAYSAIAECEEDLQPKPKEPSRMDYINEFWQKLKECVAMSAIMNNPELEQQIREQYNECAKDITKEGKEYGAVLDMFVDDFAYGHKAPIDAKELSEEFRKYSSDFRTDHPRHFEK